MKHAWIVSATLVAACGGGSSSPDPDYSQLRQSELRPESLRPADGAELERYIKNGLLLQSDGARTVDDSLAEVGGSTSETFSTTNVHVPGVDEADYVKYDGQRIYMSAYADNQDSPPGGTVIRILDADPEQAQVTPLAEVSVDGEGHGIPTLYRVPDQSGQTRALAALRTISGARLLAGPDIYPPPGVSAEAPHTHLDILDVSDPENPDGRWQLEMDGELVGSRRIGRFVYLVTGYYPGNGIRLTATDSPQPGPTRESRIQSLSLDELLPAYRINGGAAQPLVDDYTCLVASGIGPFEGYGRMTVITVVDLEQEAVRSSRCIGTRTDGIYADQASLYVGGSAFGSYQGHGSFTVVHKFALDRQNVIYRASGFVPGYLDWSRAGFFMSEHQGDLRVVSSSRDADTSGPKHHLFILREGGDHGGRLERIARLPNSTRPQRIGKPGEDLYAVRFFGNKAYAVTFRRIDPLYVLDLSDPGDPRIAGELEVPGFSTYLHPIDESLLFSLGRNTTDGVGGGIKVALFDVGDMSAPEPIGSVVLGSSFSTSPALDDLRALSFLRYSEDRLRVTIPVSVYNSNHKWEGAGLHLFEIDGIQSGAATLHYPGIITGDDQAPHGFTGTMYTDRGVMHGESVFYMHRGRVRSAFWSHPELVYGPR